MEKSQEINKEKKYRIEMFQLLTKTLPPLSSSEIELLKEIFFDEKINNEELMKRISGLT